MDPAAAHEAPAPDALVGRQLHSAPVRANASPRPRPDRLQRPAGSTPCPFCPGHEDGRAATDQLPTDGPWHARAIANLYPLLPAGAPPADPAGPPGSPDPTGVHEVLVLSRDHNADLAEMTAAHAGTALQLLGRRLHALAAQGWPDVVGWVNAGVLSGSSQPHPHAQVLASDHPFPATTAEAKASAQPCSFCAELIAAASGGLVVRAGEHLTTWVPAHPLARREVRIATNDHDLDVGDLLTGAPAHDLAAAVTGALAAIRSTLGPVSYNLAWHISTRRARVHQHLHVLPRMEHPGGGELATGLLFDTRTPARWADQLRQATHPV